jgi:hypothetical protein
MVQEDVGMAAFDGWVRDFVAHVTAKGLVPGIKKAERAAQSTTNQQHRKTG